MYSAAEEDIHHMYICETRNGIMKRGRGASRIMGGDAVGH